MQALPGRDQAKERAEVAFDWSRLGDFRGRRVKGRALVDQQARAAAGKPHGQLRAIGDFKLGDRVDCRRIRYEGTGTVVAISDDLAENSGGTKLYPTLYVELDAGGGDWYSGVVLQKRPPGAVLGGRARS